MEPIHKTTGAAPESPARQQAQETQGMVGTGRQPPPSLYPKAQRPNGGTPADSANTHGQTQDGILRDQRIPATNRIREDYQSDINRALLKAGAPCWIHIREVRRNDKGTISGVTTEMCTVENLGKYEDVIIKAARTVDLGIIGFEQNEAWQKLKIHGVPLRRYVGRGTNGLEKLLEETHAENAGVVIPMAARCLGRVTPFKGR
ncbi:hypothetical protein FPQ18DRAFT_405642 [Pyronema domesticum]|nr:hypothetical protein FPQ18DRAFT_405642 [Pyronema domesticum]